MDFCLCHFCFLGHFISTIVSASFCHYLYFRSVYRQCHLQTLIMFLQLVQKVLMLSNSCVDGMTFLSAKDFMQWQVYIPICIHLILNLSSYSTHVFAFIPPFILILMFVCFFFFVKCSELALDGSLYYYHAANVQIVSPV